MTSLASRIEWTDTTWNPTSGCTKVSPGCDRCYAERLTERFHGRGSFAQVRLHPARLGDPLRWRRGRRVFVNSMSDLFHRDVPDEFIARVWAVMAAAPRHTFQVLTKRAARMRSLLNRVEFRRTVLTHALAYDDASNATGVEPPGWWPLDNVWLGVSVEDQKRAELRIPPLLHTPAVVRFLSCEPLLGPVDLTGMAGIGGDGKPRTWDALDHDEAPGIDWVIVGGESGPGARPMHLEWARSVVEQCLDGDIACFVKQLGTDWARQHGGDPKGGDPTTWPAELRLVRQFPTPARSGEVTT